MTGTTRLELTWIGKQPRPRLEPRILVEDESHSYRAPGATASSSNNRIVHGDNLLGLKALEQEFTGVFKCIFIDPPYNTGTAFQHYDDGVEHSLWLSLMRDRLELLWRMLRQDGSLWITIDDNECHYLKVLCDELFGRSNFVASMVWEKDAGRKNDTDISTSHDYILVYAKDKSVWRHTRNRLVRTEKQLKRYQNPDNDPRGPWRQGADGTAKSGGENARFPITLPSGDVITPPKGNFWRFSKETFEEALAEGRVYFGREGKSSPVIKKYLSDIQDGVVPKTWWPSDEVGSNQEARRDHLRKLLPDIEPFSTPKPERLLHRILEIATNPGDWVLDSFAGSGTTGAVAHKMGRRWVMIELAEHCFTHLLPRIRKVVDGEDPWGVTDATGWEGGGGYRVLRLAPSLLEKDGWGNWVVNKKYNAAMLSAAMCKHEGFRYAPSDVCYWQHGSSTERDFIYVTTQTLTKEQLEQLSHDVGEERTLLICCGAFRAGANSFANLTIKKIPNAVLSRCEWGRDDYSLNVADDVAAEPDSDPPKRAGKAKKNSKSAAQTLPLFGEGK